MDILLRVSFNLLVLRMPVQSIKPELYGGKKASNLCWFVTVGLPHYSKSTLRVDLYASMK